MTNKKIGGTPRIVIGSLLMLWGVFSALYGLGNSQGVGPFPGLLLFAAGIWLLILGLNSRRRSLDH
ncbi:hypothetical protein [Rathayibacter tritici]|uniref:hypothetical protein n=1 Tax=Rathayibacter tritici TaxID=33888 RepID=UPI0011B08736|nr:hypothetical protein [Rathayibacter tritici]